MQEENDSSTLRDQTVTSKKTTIAPKEQGSSETTSRIWKWRGRIVLPLVDPAEHVLFALTGPTQPHWLTCNRCWVKKGEAIPPKCVTMLVTSLRRSHQLVVVVYSLPISTEAPVC
ncbi:hypothetical protein AMECASPLE_039675 [Ameca splendens]|uniref:Uncharacterized protein n=1 Tax=Ameca splendens TaxID=208324 RepID=A0ABV0ZI66_9TELE